MLPEGTSALPGRVRLWPYQGSIAVAIGSLANDPKGRNRLSKRLLSRRQFVPRLRVATPRKKLVGGDGGAWVLPTPPGPAGSADRHRPP